jgi:hypothetical protein
MSESFINLKTQIKSAFTVRFKSHSIYLNNETTNDLVLNFHERKYRSDMENQRHMKPIVVRIPTDVLSDISEMPNFINSIAITKVGDFIEVNLKDNPTMRVVVPTNVY